jgi:curli biogenesis system outer membrane secretion channel CsgG
MHPVIRLRPALIATALVGLGALTACSNTPSQQALQTVRSQANPTDRAQRTITNFTPALRCMDDLMFKKGTRDVTLMMEEMRDSTQRVPISTRDMMTSAVSEMTRRSRAVRLSVFGGDQQNLSQLLQQAQKTSVFQVVPEFNVRGTVSQLDEDVKRSSASFGVQIQELFGLRVASETRFSVLAFDAAVVRTDTFALVPGVTSKNTTVLARRDSSAGDGQARIQTTGTVFAFSSGRSEGTSGAARNMVELAAIELVGKLIKAPYWQCLGIEDTHPEVQREIEDWFLGMDEAERTIFLKTRLRERGYFDGTLDGSASPAFNTALQAYRNALGLPAAAQAVDLAFFTRLITRAVPTGPFGVLPRITAATASVATPAGTQPTPTAAAAQTVAATAETPQPAPATALPTAQLQMKAARGAVQLNLQLKGTEGAYVYCYAQDPASGSIRRIFPNRFAPDPRVNANRAVSLPGRGSFKLAPQHQYACVLAPREVYSALPPQLRWGDFEDIRLTDFDAIRDRFAEASGLPVVLFRPQP